ncbi:MAG: ABC transporter substrate-binding protein [Desulfobacterales bacterium]|nr:ABC transporter substrate-binding protein [Desulfobacterales bacterium]MDD4072833.1 ABC transporter substrate-binding protein [Desulfobacterales bacterium]MDD4391295.1 ABC transporter substrate-binding protein [Desulfobacterales bacterium]
MLFTLKLKPIFILLSLIIAACLWLPAASPAADTYKIGGIFSSTGPASFLGDPEKKTMQMVIDTVNERGGVDGHLLEAVIYDSEGDPQKAVSAINKLIHKDRVIAVIGPSTTPTTLAVASFAERAQIPLISCAAGIKITDPVKPWIFKTAQSDVLAVSAVYRRMRKTGIHDIAILTVSNAYGESGKNQLENQAKAFGIRIVRAESFGAKDTDMTAQLTKIRTAAPEAIVCWGTNPGPAVVAKNVRQLNITIPLYQSHGVASPKFLELAGDAAEGILLPTGKILVASKLPETDAQKPVLKTYIDQYSSRWGQEVSGFGGYAYDAVNMLIKALEGSNGDRNKIRAALEGMEKHVGVSGIFNFSKTDHNGLTPDAFVMVQIRNNDWRLVDAGKN